MNTRVICAKRGCGKYVYRKPNRQSAKSGKFYCVECLPRGHAFVEVGPIPKNVTLAAWAEAIALEVEEAESQA